MTKQSVTLGEAAKISNDELVGKKKKKKKTFDGYHENALKHFLKDERIAKLNKHVKKGK